MLLRKTCAALLFGAVFSAVAQEIPDTFENVDRIVAIGDVHGDFERFTEILRTAKLIDTSNKWAGGKTHLVLTGDYLDRGPASRKVLDLLMKLEPQALAAGGRVHALLGNHEAMNIYGDLRYVSKEDYESYRAPDSVAMRERAYRSVLDALKEQKKSAGNLATFRKTFDAEHPLGWLEQRLAFGPRGQYGAWLLRQNVIIKINDVIFLHGGISGKYAGATRKEINDRIREELTDSTKLAGGMTNDVDGPLWYAGMADLPASDSAISALVDRVLAAQQAHHIVIGHTPAYAVTPRFGGKVIVIDTGLSKVFGGPPAFLVIDHSKYYAVHRGKQLDLPVDGGDTAAYMKSVLALEPAGSQLRGFAAKNADKRQ